MAVVFFLSLFFCYAYLSVNSSLVSDMIFPFSLQFSHCIHYEACMRCNLNYFFTAELIGNALSPFVCLFLPVNRLEVLCCEIKDFVCLTVTVVW